MRTVAFNYPFRLGNTASLESALATGLFDVAVAGRGYQLDLASNLFTIQSLEFMRSQQDQGKQAGEGSLSNSTLWRRSLRSYHLGAGQSRGDEETSSPYRFLDSKGINPWDKWYLSLLNDTTLVRSATSTPIGAVVVGDTLMVQSGATIRTSTDGTAWATVATLPAAATALPASDGSVMFTACSDGNIKSVTTTGTVTDEWGLSGVDILTFAKGRLWAGAGNALYPVTPGSTVTAEFTHPWSGWRWSALTEGPRAVYAAGALGDKSQIYRIPFKTDGTGFDSAVVAATLPDGEVVTSLASYLGFMLIGTTLGMRFAVPDATGDITYGALIPTPNPVLCFEPQDKFVWFGWTDYDNASTGLGRVDLEGFTIDITPAYASDLMFDGQGEVTSIVTFGGVRVFTVAGQGVVSELDGVKTPVGVLTGSAWTFGLSDKKVASVLNFTHKTLDGQINFTMSVDGSGFAVVAESSTQGTVGPARPVVIPPVKGDRFSFGITLVAGVAEGPSLTGFTFSARPAPVRGKKFVLPLMLVDQSDLDNIYTPQDPDEEQVFLEALVENGASVTLQVGTRNYQVFPMDFRFVPYRKSGATDAWAGTFVLELDEVTT